MDTSSLQNLATAIKKSSRIVSLTGAGISVASGIPDFRSEGGLWTRYDPSLYASYSKFVEDPSYFWEMHIETMRLIDRARPNPAHRALADLEELGLLKGVITQNIDGLHQDAGTSTVYELHGTNKTSSCIICRRQYPTKEIADHIFSFQKEDLIRKMRRGNEIPACDCGGWIKPDVILFGEKMSHEVAVAAQELASSCDLLLVVGTSLQVQPAASLPFATKHNGGAIAFINREPTFLNRIADHVFLGKAEEILPELVNMLNAAT
ncbi:MAG: NAD-dependent deacylase [Theionarchaea archaeon]|nr:NAD-dependent deacylase [Theionarchaea archaeon]MBU7037543.1 NAD-dependent deacylase [Theionarchaea archaeon]